MNTPPSAQRMLPQSCTLKRMKKPVQMCIRDRFRPELEDALLASSAPSAALVQKTYFYGADKSEYAGVPYSNPVSYTHLYWFEQHEAVPAAMSHDELEFLLPAPVPEEKAMDAAVELYGFCPDVIDQGPEDATVGALADVLRQSTVWYFWWD